MLETARESRWLPDLYGGVAQLGEHLPCKQGVKSSNLSISIVEESTQLNYGNFENYVFSVIASDDVMYVPKDVYLENRI